MRRIAARNKPLRATGLPKKSVIYEIKDNPSEFYVSEQAATYGNNGTKPYTVYYRNQATR